MRSVADERAPATLPQGTRAPARSGLSPVLARVMAPQRAAGNTAVTQLFQHRSGGDPTTQQTAATTHAERDSRAAGEEKGPRADESPMSGPNNSPDSAAGDRQAPGRTISLTIQRAPTQNSDPTLRNLYTELMQHSATFRELDRIVTAQRDIHLVDGHWNGRAAYSMESHAIMIPIMPPTAEGRRSNRFSRQRPQPRPMDVLRAELLFEMHNARNRGANTRIRELLATELPDSASATETLLAPYRAAAFALASEWEEWSRIAEFNLRTDRINTEVGGPAVRSLFGQDFDTPDQKWFLFQNYLQTQLSSRHTNYYDRAAGAPDWAGHRILNLALSTSPASLRITQREFMEFSSGQRRSLKSDGVNPFKSENITRLAAGFPR